MIFNMVGGGAGGAGGGATLVVSSPANVSVTVSKDDKSYTKNSGSLGSTTFKGLATGTWTVVISNNGQTATRTIEITADYAITIAFFSASINITYPATSTCVVTNASGQTIASDTNDTSSEKTWTATVGAVGVYTITISTMDGTKEKVGTVTITSDGQTVSITLRYELALVTTTGGLDAAYTPDGVRLIPAIDITDYNTMSVEVARTYTTNPTYSLYFALKNAETNKTVAKFVVKDGTRKFYNMDISAYTGLHYFISEGTLSRRDNTLLSDYGGSVKATVYSALFTEEVL